ncbi:hypothetical protein ACWGJW_22890, partial [Streptomyces nigrescens]
ADCAVRCGGHGGTGGEKYPPVTGVIVLLLIAGTLRSFGAWAPVAVCDPLLVASAHFYVTLTQEALRKTSKAEKCGRCVM